jgi:uncharacterized small protein (DUF1192 family)
MTSPPRRGNTDAASGEEDGMVFEDDRPAAKPATHVVGEDLSRLSVAELEARAAALRAEVERTEAAIAAKRSTEDAANALFRR